MGSGNKKKGQIDMGNYVAKPREQDAYVWCIHNNINRIYKVLSRFQPSHKSLGLYLLYH